MGLNFRLIQRTAKTSTSDVMHSTGYASASSGAQFGSSDNTTFSERQQIEQSRKLIKGYRNARVAQGVNRVPSARTYEQEQAVLAAMGAIERSERDAGNISRRQCFNNNRDQGGIQRFDYRSRQAGTINRTAGATQTNNRQVAADMRAARAGRFEAAARPTPKSGFGR